MKKEKKIKVSLLNKVFTLFLVLAIAFVVVAGVRAYSGPANIVVEGNLLYQAPENNSLGGTTVDFFDTAQYVDAAEGFKINGTTVFDSSGNVTAAGTLSVTGASTLTGEVTLKEGSQAITAVTNTSTIAQSGTTFYITLASTTAGSTINLPALTEGVVLKYVMATSSATTTNIVVDSAEGDNIYGSLVVDGTAVPCAAVDQINFIVTAEAAGDFFELRSDGTFWYVTGIGEASGSITCTDPS